jgi:tRNA dimethylallyltransferase
MRASGPVAARPLLICLMGPTASGKTDLAIELAAAANCELISVDSALVYRGLDIGSAKPDYPHHLVDIRDPTEIYSAADFVVDARRVAGQVYARGHTPLLVGGTMLYFKALLEGLAPMPAADPATRRQIEAEAARYGWPWLHDRLAEVDPDSARRIHPNHSQRLGRALEVFRASGVTMTEWRRRQAGAALPLAGYRVVQLAICPLQRSVLHSRIARRFELMMAQGLLEEVAGLRQRGDLSPELPAIRAVGYRQLWQYLAGECSLDEAVTNAIAATRQLAKRQLTWLRKWPGLHWLYTDDEGNLAVAAGSYSAGGSAGQSPLDAALNYLASTTM